MTLSMSINNSKCLDFFIISPSQISMIRSTCFYTILETQGLNHMDMKNIGFPILPEKREKKIPNFILNLIDAYRNMWKTVLDESHMYDLKGGLLYLLRSTLQFGIKKPK